MKLPKQKRRRRRDNNYLEGQLLVAMPRMTDRRFARSVIYLCAHSEEGARVIGIRGASSRHEGDQQSEARVRGIGTRPAPDQNQECQGSEAGARAIGTGDATKRKGPRHRLETPPPLF